MDNLFEIFKMQKWKLGVEVPIFTNYSIPNMVHFMSVFRKLSRWLRPLDSSYKGLHLFFILNKTIDIFVVLSSVVLCVCYHDEMFFIMLSVMAITNIIWIINLWITYFVSDNNMAFFPYNTICWIDSVWVPRINIKIKSYHHLLKM